jgi:ribonucleoside-diphosphate reductase beta chain
MAVREGFQTTRGGLRDCLALRLYEKAKRLGVWDPSALDLSRDPADWERMSEPERQGILQISTFFLAGEEAVTLDLLPLVLAIAREGRLEEELFLTSFLWEEGKHLQLFRRWLDEVAGRPEDLKHWVTPSYRRLFAEELPSAMDALLADPSPAAQVRAAVTYNMIVEGVLAETGYAVYHDALEQRDLLPGLRTGIAHVKRDESRHIAYGVYLLSRLVAADADLWPILETRMNELLPIALAFVDESFEGIEDLDEPPFGILPETVASWATANFAKRFARIERARGRSLAQIEAESLVDEPS